MKISRQSKARLCVTVPNITPMAVDYKPYSVIFFNNSRSMVFRPFVEYRAQKTGHQIMLTTASRKISWFGLTFTNQNSLGITLLK